jgi:hypothetical protein
MIVLDRQDELGEWLASRTGGIYITGSGRYIGLEKNGVITSVAGFEDYNGASIRGHLAVDDNRMDKKWMKFCFEYVFCQLKVKKLIGLVSSANTKALRLDKHFGYIEEGIIKDAAPDGDLHILTMTKEQCRILNK